MARSFFQRPRGTGFQGRYSQEFEEDEWPRPRLGEKPKFWFYRLPLIVKVIVIMLAMSVGIILGFVAWIIEIAFIGP
jgi:hypothetical protein